MWRIHLAAELCCSWHIQLYELQTHMTCQYKEFLSWGEAASFSAKRSWWWAESGWCLCCTVFVCFTAAAWGEGEELLCFLTCNSGDTTPEQTALCVYLPLCFCSLQLNPRTLQPFVFPLFPLSVSTATTEKRLQVKKRPRRKVCGVTWVSETRILILFVFEKIFFFSHFEFSVKPYVSCVMTVWLLEDDFLPISCKSFPQGDYGPLRLSEVCVSQCVCVAVNLCPWWMLAIN